MTVRREDEEEEEEEEVEVEVEEKYELKIFGKSLTHCSTNKDKVKRAEKEDNVDRIAGIDRKSRRHSEFQRKTLHSSLRALNRHRLYVETSALSSTISTASRRRRSSSSISNSNSNSNSSIELKIFDVASIGLRDNVKDNKEGSSLLVDTSQLAREKEEEEEEEEEKKGEEKDKDEDKDEDKNKIGKPTVVLTPHIEIVDYDRIGGTSSQSDRHACPKCTSEGQLRLQVDPFRSPITYDASNGASINGTQTRTQSILNRKKKEIDRSNIPGRSTWPDGRIASFATGYLAKRELNFARKKRNELSAVNQQTCRPYDLCKEATLRRHYYPEGGWGYVIVTCSMLVHLLGVGLQFAAPGTWHRSAELKFDHPPLHSAGLWLTIRNHAR
ncbi:uncharacterized protein LOC122524264 [Polistes fuscatus]|uniref:uncharacterized protein LOC122524264 n=1 Tax=Polistes fuscatus TaxID=30207 RepID=UPI001CA8C1BB|nr:uncharacterized protein LOC122524264 [Polistes fuscatus]